MKRHLPFVALLLSTLALPLAPAAAQCAPDGLDGGPCCTVADLKLPTFPVIFQDSLDICWNDCDVESLGNCRARWGNMKPYIGEPTSCGRFRQRLRLSDAAGVKKWSGRMNLTYSRTWVEIDATGLERQVWRFLANGKLKPTPAAGNAPCPVPSCIPTFPNARFTGYIDYAQDCGGGPFSIAWMLTHSCDVIDHNPGFPRGGFFHPGRAFTFVGPAAGFAIGPIQPTVVGGTSLEAVRRVRLPMGGTVDTFCEFEEQIDCGLSPQQEFCICGSPNGPPQYAISSLGLGGACGTQISTPGGPFLPGYISMGIGRWTDPSTYPGLEGLRWNCGGYDYFDPCTGVTREEVFYGVTTLGGDFAIQLLSNGFGVPLPRNFIDQANSLRKKDNLSTTMNTPFASDHILNLNFQ